MKHLSFGFGASNIRDLTVLHLHWANFTYAIREHALYVPSVNQKSLENMVWIPRVDLRYMWTRDTVKSLI